MLNYYRVGAVAAAVTFLLLQAVVPQMELREADDGSGVPAVHSQGLFVRHDVGVPESGNWFGDDGASRPGDSLRIGGIVLWMVSAIAGVAWAVLEIGVPGRWGRAQTATGTAAIIIAFVGVELFREGVSQYFRQDVPEALVINATLGPLLANLMVLSGIAAAAIAQLSAAKAKKSAPEQSIESL